MEVFINNLPAQGNLSDRSLKLQLQPLMRRLHISESAYDCEKPLRKRYAYITFLSAADGQKFLSVYGEVKKPKGPGMVSRLSILGARIFCKKSDRSPHDITLRGLAMQAEKNATAPEPPTTNADGSSGRNPLEWFNMLSFSCGYYTFVHGKLAYVPEVTERNPGTVRFGKRHVTLERDDGIVIQIPIATIVELVWSPNGALILTLTTVPLFLSAQDASQENKRSRLTALNARHANVVGMCLVYHFSVAPSQIHRKIQRLKDFGSLTVSRHDVPLSSGSDFAHSLQQLKSVLSRATKENLLPFPLLLQLQALVYNAYLHPDTVATLTRKLIEIRDTTPVSVQAMKKLFNAIDWPTPNHHDPSEFEVPALVDFLLEKEKEIQDGFFVRDGLVNPGQNLTPVYRVVITPTRMTLHGPELENKNRVLRKFPNHHDYFIRVQFCDEDGQSLRFSSRIEFANVYSRFKAFMTRGIQVAGRTYSFLGWSHSSLRAHSMWFTAPFFDDTAQFQTHFSIISMLGDFNEIYSPARCAARIGQAFSETPFTVPVAENGITVVSRLEDVKSIDGSRVFSDGVGTISAEAIAFVWNHLPRGKKQPTCLQIRYAGAKGMLSLDTRLPGRQIRLRESMVKFDSGETMNLEICDTASQPISLYLNRQLVKILEDMGVPKSWFLRLQTAALKELQLITSSSYNMANYLKAQSVASAIKLHKLLLLAEKLGIDYRTDSFLRRATDAVVLRELRLLKEKARMFVPYGITLFGVMDETGFLEEGEVYVTFEKKEGSKSQRFKSPPTSSSPLLVTRSPALHPGDIQRARNIIPPEGHPLRDLCNCIIFSAQGVRDLPSQLSGGDLDGDIFNIIWDPDVCYLPKLCTFDAADYPRQAPLDIGHRVQTEDIAEFFIDFMRTDHLGTIATRHMILADQKPEGTRARECIDIAAMHSTAVDFSKTGIPADLRQLPRANKFRPDFLAPGAPVRVHDRSDIELEEYIDPAEDKDEDRYGADAPKYEYYRSEKTLGVLYRAVDEKRIWQENVQVSTSRDNDELSFYNAFLRWATVECQKLGCREWRRRSEDAMRIRSAYNDAILSTMYEFSEHPTLPITELEVFIGTIINKTGAQTIRQRDRSRKLHDEFERISSWITSHLRARPWEDDDDASEDVGAIWFSKHLDILELCLASVYSHKTSREQASGRGETCGEGRKDRNELQSFWLVAACALLRELDFIKHARAIDAELEVEQLGFAHLSME